MSEITETTENQEILEVQTQDISGCFSQELIFSKKKFEEIQKSKLNLKEKDGFREESFSTIRKLFPRKDIVYYGISNKEMSITIKDAKGRFNIPLINKETIMEKLSKIPEKDREKIGYIHLGGIQILIKAHFREGIDTPIKLALLDNRITNRKDALLGMINGNLGYQKLKFTAYPRFAVNIQDKNLNQVLSLAYDFERGNLMKEGNHPFSIHYLVGYSLTNSHNSSIYGQHEYIEIDKTFKDIGQIIKNPEKLPEYEVPDEWNLDIKEKPLITSRRNNVQRITFVDTQPKATNREIKELKEEIEEMKELVYTMK